MQYAAVVFAAGVGADAYIGKPVMACLQAVICTKRDEKIK